MKTYSLYLISILSLSSSSLAGTVPNQQHPFMNVHYTNDDESTPKIHGKFLHLTDIHVSKYYEPILYLTHIFNVYHTLR